MQPKIGFRSSGHLQCLVCSCLAFLSEPICFLKGMRQDLQAPNTASQKLQILTDSDFSSKIQHYNCLSSPNVVALNALGGTKAQKSGKQSKRDQMIANASARGKTPKGAKVQVCNNQVWELRSLVSPYPAIKKHVRKMHVEFAPSAFESKGSYGVTQVWVWSELGRF